MSDILLLQVTLHLGKWLNVGLNPAVVLIFNLHKVSLLYTTYTYWQQFLTNFICMYCMLLLFNIIIKMTISISCNRFRENKWMKWNENKSTKVTTTTITTITNTIINNATTNTTSTTPTTTIGDLQHKLKFCNQHE